MKKHTTVILIVILLVAGAGTMLYPTISNLIAVYSQDMTIRYYDDAVDRIDPDVIAAEWEKARDYNAMQADVTFADPFNVDDGAALVESYLSVLNVEGVMGHIKIPKIDVYIPMYHGTSEAVISKGAGHLAGSGLPIGGKGNHAVLTSHSGLPSAKLFTDLELMEPGDMFYLYVLGEVLAYEVDQILIVEPNEIEALLPAEDEDYVTLITCTPYAINSHRLLVRGTRVPYEEKADEVKRSVQTHAINWRVFVIIAVAALSVMVLCIHGFRARRKKRGGR